MMYQLLVYTGADAYEYSPVLRKQVHNHSLPYLKDIMNELKQAFLSRDFNYFHGIIIELDPMNQGEAIVVNEFGTHPLKKRIEINEKAKELKEGAKAKKKPINPEGPPVNVWQAFSTNGTGIS